MKRRKKRLPMRVTAIRLLWVSLAAAAAAAVYFVHLYCIPFTLEGAFRQEERSNLYGPSEILYRTVPQDPLAEEQATNGHTVLGTSPDETLLCRFQDYYTLMEIFPRRDGLPALSANMSCPTQRPVDVPLQLISRTDAYLGLLRDDNVARIIWEGNLIYFYSTGCSSEFESSPPYPVTLETTEIHDGAFLLLFGNCYPAEGQTATVTGYDASGCILFTTEWSDDTELLSWQEF